MISTVSNDCSLSVPSQSPRNGRWAKLLAPGGWPHSLAIALLCVVGVRLFLTLEMVVLAVQIPLLDLQARYGATGVPVVGSGWEGALLGVWQREDALWYQKIATMGYSTTDMTQEFFPLYPMLIRLLWTTTGLQPVAAGIVISELSLLVALFLLHRMVVARYGVGVATRSLLYLSLFPTAFFFHAPFSESLTLALVALAFYLLSRGGWKVAAVTAFLAGMARPQGVLLGPALAVGLLAQGKTIAGWRQFAWDRGRLVKSFLLAVAPLVGLALFLLLVDTAWRRPGVYSGIGPGHGIPSFPGAAIFYAAKQMLGGEIYQIELFNLMSALLFLGLLVVAFRRMDAGWATYAALFYLASTSRYLPVFPLMSFCRYLLLLFPCFVVLGMLVRGRWFSLGYLLVGLLMMAFWTGAFYFGGFVG
jgi:hypothetical protein